MGRVCVYVHVLFRSINELSKKIIKEIIPTQEGTPWDVVFFHGFDVPASCCCSIEQEGTMPMSSLCGVNIDVRSLSDKLLRPVLLLSAAQYVYSCVLPKFRAGGLGARETTTNWRYSIIGGTKKGEP